MGLLGELIVVDEVLSRFDRFKLPVEPGKKRKCIYKLDILQLIFMNQF